MGLFGPTKKGGGLDKRFRSNKGGYLGKAIRFAGSSSSSSNQRSSYTPLTQQQKEGLKHLRLLNNIDIEGDIAKGLVGDDVKAELIGMLDHLLSKYIKINDLMDLSGISDEVELDSDAYWGSVKSQARLVYDKACKKLKEFSPNEAADFENTLSKIVVKEKEIKYMKKPYYRFIAKTFNISILDARKYFIFGTIIFILILFIFN